MLIKLGFLRRLVREAAMTQDAWVPSRWEPTSGEPMSPHDMDRLGQPLGEDEDLDEVDTDPSNNPGRPADAFEYLGMRPDPKAAMAPTSLSGGGSGDSDTADPSSPPDEPTEDNG